MSERIRFATPDDAAGIAAIYAPLVAQTIISFEETPPDAGEMRARITGAQDCWPWLVCDDGSELAGYVYAGPHRSRAGYRWSVDVSVYVGDAHRRRGLARALYAVLFDVLVAQGYYQAFAGIALPNEPSVALHRAVGFEVVGTYHNVGYKLGSWHDVVWLGRALRRFDGPPKEPRPLAALDTPELERALLTVNARR